GAAGRDQGDLVLGPGQQRLDLDVGHPGELVAHPGLPTSVTASSRRAARRILPVSVRGSSATNSIRRGVLNPAITLRQCSMIASASAALPWCPAASST